MSVQMRISSLYGLRCRGILRSCKTWLTELVKLEYLGFCLVLGSSDRGSTVAELEPRGRPRIIQYGSLIRVEFELQNDDFRE